ncbi:MAG: FMN-binding protein [Oscillospiraceae bacterium]
MSPSLFDDIVKANGTEIDGVSGATMSSNGVKAAVNDALSKALVTEPEQPDTGIFAAGTGAKSDPYLIRTVDQIKAFAASVNGGETYASQYVTLDADLDLTGESWTPIGGDSGSFNGIFNGDNHTIAGLTIGTKAEPAAYEYASLFGLVGKGGAIRNLGVKDAFINNKTTDEDPAVAILAAGTGDSSVIDGCWVSGTIISDAAGDNNYTYVGGVVGNNGGKSLVCNTWADVQIVAKGSDTGAGGIVGWTSNDSAVINCAAFGTIGNYCEGSMMYGAGGIVGYSCGAIYACYSDVTLHMDAMSDAGDGSDVPIGGIAGAPAYCTAAYRCWFNADAAQTYYNDEAVAEPVAVGYSTLSYSVSDQEECAGLTSAELTSGVLETNLADALTEEKLADAQAYFSARPSACWATALR